LLVAVGWLGVVVALFLLLGRGKQLADQDAFYQAQTYEKDHQVDDVFFITKLPIAGRRDVIIMAGTTAGATAAGATTAGTATAPPAVAPPVALIDGR
jgi:hypothetical protein